MTKNRRMASYLLASLLVMLMIVVAMIFHGQTLIYPPLVALAFGVFVFRPKRWLQEPLKIWLIPSMTGLVGFLLGRLSWNHMVKAFVMLSATLVILHFARSVLVPALAFGILPLGEQVTSWLFVLFIFIFTLILFLFHFFWNKDQELVGPSADLRFKHILAFFLISLAWLALCWVFQLHLIFIPPVLAVTYDILQRSEFGSKEAVKYVAALLLVVSLGSLCFLVLQAWLLIAVADILLASFVLRLFKIATPVMYAAAFLPFITSGTAIHQLPIFVFLMSLFFIDLSYFYKKIFP